MPTHSPTDRVPIWLWGSLALTAALCLASLTYRYRVEQANRAVGLVVEADVVADLAAVEGVTPAEAFALLKKRGVNGLVVQEATIGALINDGKAEISNGFLFVRVDKERVAAAVKRSLPGLEKAPATLGMDVYTLGATSSSLVRSTSIGLDTQGAGLASWADVFVVARLGNPPASRSGAIGELLRACAAETKKARFLLPMGDQVIGRKGSMGSVLEALKAADMYYATAEFAKIAGDSTMVEQAPERTVRLHTAQVAELDKMTDDGVVERYAKAATERNQRLLLLRPLTRVGAEPLSDFARLVTSLRRQLEKEGLTLAEPHPFADSQVPRLLFPLIGLSLVPSAFWMAGRVFARKAALAAGVLVALLGLACYVETGRQLAALVAAMGFPVVSFALLERVRWKHPVIGFAVMSAVSLVGGLCVAGLLNGLPFLVRADVFQGVKLAHFLPLAFILAYLLWKSGTLAGALGSTIRWKDLLWAVVALGAVGFMISRTGNDNPAGVSGVEMQLRSLLEQWLVVRPRTKEFLIGHPLLIVGIGMLARHGWSQNRSIATAILLTAGAIGQTSIVNTLCHLHTPLTVGFERILVGWVLGGILGWILWGVVRRIQPAA